MDVTSVVLAVDSTQVNSAAAALEKMAASGGKAEASAAKLTKTTADQGKTLAAVVVPATAKVAAGFEEVAAAQSELAKAKPIDVAAQLAAAEKQANQLSKTFARIRAQQKEASNNERLRLDVGGGNVTPVTTGAALPSRAGDAFSSAAERSAAALAAEAARAKSAVVDLSTATTSLGAVSFERVTSSLKATSVAALEAARSMIQLRDAEARAGTLAGALGSAKTTPGAGGAAPATISDEAAINSFATAAARANVQAGTLGKTLAADMAGGATRAKTSVTDLSKATTSLGASSFANLDKATTSLGATATEADHATRSVNTLRKALSLAGPLATATTSPGATGPAPVRAAGSAAVVSPIPADAAATAAAFAAAAGKANTQTDALGKSARFAAFQHQQLAFQLHDFGVQVISGQNPLTAFIQQGSQLSGTFGGAGNAFKAVTGLLTPLRLAIGGAAVGIGALAIAFLEGQKQSKAFADSLIISGNFAGQTEGKFTALTRAIATSTKATVGDVREFGQALISTGEIGPQVFAAATTAAVGYAQATGKTADEVAKDFAAMARAPAKFAVEANRQFNFLTAAQIQTIKAFEDNGRAADAQGVILDALNARFPKLNQNLGVLEGVLKVGKSAWSSFWDSAFDIGRTQTIEQKIADTANKIKAAQVPEAVTSEGGAAFVYPNSGRRTSTLRTEANRLAVTLDGQKRDQQLQTELAFRASLAAATQKEGIAARQSGEADLASTKTKDALNKALAELEVRFQKAERAGVGFTDAEKKAQIELAKQRNTTKGPQNNEPEQVRRANLDADIRKLQDGLQQERDAITFHNRFLQGEYQAGNVSLTAFYADKRATTAAAVAAEIAELDKEKARFAQDRDAVKDPSEKKQLQTKIDDTERLQAKIRRDAANEVELANQQERETFKQLSDQVTSYRANLLAMQGDEAGSAVRRASQQHTQFVDLAARSQGTDNPISAAEVDANAKSLRDQLSVNEAKRQTSFINERLQLEEERIAIAQRTGALSENAALQKQGEARAKLLPQLEAQAKELQRVADENPANIELQLDASRARLEIEKLSAELDPLKEKFDNLFKGAGANALETLFNGGGLKNAGKQFLQQITQSFNKDAAKELSDAIFGKGGIFGGAGKALAGGKQSAGGLEGQVAEFFGLKKPADEKQQVVDIFKEPAGNAASVTASFTALQTTGIDPATSALTLLAQAAEDASGSFGRASGVQGAAGGAGGAGGDATFTPAGGFDFGGATTGEKSVFDLFKEFSDSSAKSAKATADFGTQADAAAGLVSQLGRSAGGGSSALALLPGIVNAFQVVVAAFSGGSTARSAGSLVGAIGAFFGGGTKSGSAGTVGGSFSGSGIGGSGISDAFAGFDTGGYTGNKGTKEPAGIVHGKEFVFSAPAVKRIGVSELDRIHKAAKNGTPGYESGGYVGSTMPASGRQWLMPGAGRGIAGMAPDEVPAKPVQQVTVNAPITISVAGQVDRRTAEQLTAAAARGARMAISRGTA